MNQSRAEKIAAFNPDGVGLVNDSLFGLPFTEEECAVVVIPVPWEVTTSYHRGTAAGPAGILEASSQLDLFHPELGEVWKAGFFLRQPAAEILQLNDELLPRAHQLIELLEAGKAEHEAARVHELQAQITSAGRTVNTRVLEQARQLLAGGKLPAVLGGEHSTPLGLLQALNEHYDSFGILQLDAHADLRRAYMGLEFSHASIMYNALQLPAVTQLTQVGVRDYSPGEHRLIQASADRIRFFGDNLLKRRAFEGTLWHSQCLEIVVGLPQKVYVSFDIDGLRPSLCPGTGTPVPGGLSFQAAAYLLGEVVRSGRRIVGFDLCEVAANSPENDFDYNVGARVLWELCAWAVESNGILPRN